MGSAAHEVTPQALGKCTSKPLIGVVCFNLKVLSFFKLALPFQTYSMKTVHLSSSSSPSGGEIRCVLTNRKSEIARHSAKICCAGGGGGSSLL